MKSLFFRALIGKYRYNTSVGLLNSEQLVSLGHSVIKKLYVDLQIEAKKFEGIETLDGSSLNDKTLSDKITIVKEIYQWRTLQEAKSLKERGNRELAAKIMLEADIKEVKELTKGKSSKQMRKTARKLLS